MILKEQRLRSQEQSSITSTTKNMRSNRDSSQPGPGILLALSSNTLATEYHGVVKVKDITATALTQGYYQNHAPYAIRISTRKKSSLLYSSSIISLSAWLQSVLIARTVPNKVSSEKHHSINSKTYGITLEFRVLRSNRMRLSVFGFAGCGQLMRSCFHFCLSFPRVRPPGSFVFEMAQKGNINMLESLIAAGEASVFDIFPDGITLLHVRACTLFRGLDKLIRRWRLLRTTLSL